MEVHAHSHTARKKWTHYFWEFFMLFLAITLGFFVENSREHYIEHQRAKEFAVTLYSEIKKDTASLKEIRNRTHIASSSLDTLIQLLSLPLSTTNNGLLYYHCGLGMYNYYFTANEATLQQMKNSGAIRYYNNYSLVSGITEYEYNIRSLYQLEANTYINFIETRKIQLKLFDSRYIYSLLAWDSTYAAFIETLESLKSKKISLVTNDQSIIVEFRNWAVIRAELARLKVKQYDRFLESAATLLNKIKNEYKL